VRPFAHRAVLALSPGADRGAPGAAVTVALCGSWEHEPPCPLAPHHTGVDGPDDALAVRVLFAAAPDDEAEVRRRIDEALEAGETPGPDGGISRWSVLETAPDVVRESEREHAARLAAQPSD
jgi:hypothetical protein